MRLIDADTLKDTLLKHRYTTEHNQIFRYIDEQPTAYSVDKVIEELETMSQFITIKDMFKVYENVKMVATDTAIEIVKQGTVSDDVCEWKLEDEEANLYLTGCHQRQLIFDGTPKENGYRYCPYCSKKIKVVE